MLERENPPRLVYHTWPWARSPSTLVSHEAAHAEVSPSTPGQLPRTTLPLLMEEQGGLDQPEKHVYLDEALVVTALWSASPHQVAGAGKTRPQQFLSQFQTGWLSASLTGIPPVLCLELKLSCRALNSCCLFSP